MLKRVGGEIDPEGAVTTIGEADFPVPFPTGLEFNSPAHMVTGTLFIPEC